MEAELIVWFFRASELLAAFYLVLIGAYSIGWYRLKPVNFSISTRQMRVNVLIAMRNESDHIYSLLNCLHRQNYPLHLINIIIADDHSDDQSVELIKQYINRHPDLSLELIFAQGCGKKAALKQLLSAADADIVLITDADCKPGPLWIASMVEQFQSGNYKMLLGPVLLHPTLTFFEKLQSVEFMSLIGSTAGSVGIGIPLMGNGANMAISRKAALEVGGFDNKEAFVSGDDVFLLFALVKKYGRKAVGFAQTHEAIVSTLPMPDLNMFLKQRLRWVSKSKGYRNAGIIVPALVIFLFNLLLVGFLILSIFQPFFLAIYLLFIVLKLLIDYPLLHAVSGFMHKRNLLIFALPLALVYPVYVVGTAIAGNVMKVSWKGRK